MSVPEGHFLLTSPAGPAQIRLLALRGWSQDSWILTRIHWVLIRHGPVEPCWALEGPAGFDTGGVRLGDHSRAAPRQPVLTGNGQSSSPGPSAVQCKAVVNMAVAAYLAARAAQLFSVKPFGFEENFFLPVSFCYQKSSPFLQLLGLVYFDLYFLSIFAKANRHRFPSISATRWLHSLVNLCLYQNHGGKWKMPLINPTFHPYQPTIWGCVLPSVSSPGLGRPS